MKKVIIGGVVAAVLFFVLGVMMISRIAEGVYSDSAAAQQSQESGTVDPNEEIDFPVESMQEENRFSCT